MAAQNPDGIMLSNGPGDPAEPVEVIENLKHIFALNIPTFGICLGHRLCLLPIRFLEGQALLYLYRPAELRRDLQDALASELLRQAGYADESCARCVAQLIRRFRESGEFPHEVGLFLSYPPEDVKGFIDHRANGFKCAGLWKVYGDEAKAQALFAKFKKCTEIYCALWQTGSKLEQLAVAV